MYIVYQKDGARLFLVVLSNRTKGNGQKLMHRMLYLNTRKHFFTVQMTEHWDRLLREIVESPSLEILKTVWTQPWLTCSRGPCLSWEVGSGDHYGSFQRDLFCEHRKLINRT